MFHIDEGTIDGDMTPPECHLALLCRTCESLELRALLLYLLGFTADVTAFSPISSLFLILDVFVGHDRRDFRKVVQALSW